jgi:hypothetical protein
MIDCQRCKRTVSYAYACCYTDLERGYKDSDLCFNCMLEHAEEFWPGSPVALDYRNKKNNGFIPADREMYNEM